ncbi:MAG: hypothetical protein IJQ18_05750 [Paludibacteraceae bacterium]|nr:hypothetical protein [Paludibacteraceae bacterium]
MKKVLVFAAVLAIAAGFVSCQREASTFAKEDLVGRWQAPSGDTLQFMVFQPDIAPTPEGLTGEFRYGYEWDMNDHKGWDDSQGTYEDFLFTPIDENGAFHGNGWFVWQLDPNGNFLLGHLMNNDGAVIPKPYKVTVLTGSSLTYKDDFGTFHSFTKIKQ